MQLNGTREFSIYEQYFYQCEIFIILKKRYKCDLLELFLHTEPIYSVKKPK